MRDTINRFNKTVANYIKYRPAYPKEIYQYLQLNANLIQHQIIADIGSGTGLLTKIFLNNGHTVYGVEPNKLMRDAAEILLKNYPTFTSIAGQAETTSLEEDSVDWITAGTAFHWFDRAAAKCEWQRILKTPGYVLLIWNVRDVENSVLVQSYEKLIETFMPEYKQVSVQHFDKSTIVDFFNPYEMQTAEFSNRQIFDWQGLQGRLLSTSYGLMESDKNYIPMLDNLRNLFERYQTDGLVEFLYQTKLYFGQLK